ncbi:MAG TPA: TetR/AcrR family transcriptional regulator [Kofleriaceae bacterium]
MATRAQPLSPDARRASIVAATLPLLKKHGPSLTTAMIAVAAGVAEGTLFRAFTDKDEIIQETIKSAFDPSPTLQQLAAIDRAGSLREKLVAAVFILEQRVKHVWELVQILDLKLPAKPEKRPSDQVIRDQLEELMTGHEHELRVDKHTAMRALRAFAFAATHPRISDEPFTTEETVALLLEGIGI